MQNVVITKESVKPYVEGEKYNKEDEIRRVKRIRLLVFLAFKTKIVILRYVYYPDDYYVNYWLGDSIDFSENSKDIIVLDVIDPANKNALEFLSIKDLRVNGNYMYVVD